MTYRKIGETWKSAPTIEGAGVHLRRALGFQQVPRLDPFLLLDDFRNDDPDRYRRGFPWHPHRGMETITYLLDGEVEHGDSLGNEGVIRAGEVQWMTAGGGIVHQEMPKGDRRGRVYGFQLWANLPRSHKMMDPRYREVKAAEIPEVKTDSGALVRLIAGEVEGVHGAVRDVVTDPTYLDVSLPAGSSFVQPVKPGHTAFAYAFEGEGSFAEGSDAALGDGSLVFYAAEGDAVSIRTAARPVRFLLVSGQPLREPVAWSGPIVMNTQAELRAAYEDLERGTFIHPQSR